MFTDDPPDQSPHVPFTFLGNRALIDDRGAGQSRNVHQVNTSGLEGLPENLGIVLVYLAAKCVEINLRHGMTVSANMRYHARSSAPAPSRITRSTLNSNEARPPANPKADPADSASSETCSEGLKGNCA